MAISPDRKTLWVDDMLNNTVNVFSMADLKQIAVVPVGRGPDWMVFTPDGKRCYRVQCRSEYRVRHRRLDV